MITSMDQAIQVQSRRVWCGKKGYARAVRRYLNRVSKDWYGRNELVQCLPFIPCLAPEPREETK